MLFLFMLGIVSFSQTASLANVSASPGQNVPVALSVQGFSGIGSITFNIQFDAAVMSYTGMSLLPGTPSGLTAYVTGNTLNLVGSWTSFPNFNDGPILNLYFTYSGMTTATLNFLGSCAVTQGITPFSPTYTNGSVSMAVISAKASLVNTTASTGDEANVDLTYESISGNVGAITQIIHYDPTKLTFVNVIGTGVLATGINSSVNGTTGEITLTWTKTGGGANINTSGLLNKFVLKFIFIGNISTPIDFVSGCAVSNQIGTNINMYYFGGTVSPSPFTAFAVLGPVSNAQQGAVVEVPLILDGFAAGAIGGTHSFTLNIPYSLTKLHFVGLKNPVSGLTVAVNHTSGTLDLAWTNPSGPNINGVFATFKFEYLGIGTANVAFGNNCVFNTDSIGTIGTVQVGYTNGTVSPGPAVASATLGFVAGTSGTNVLVPLTFTLLPLMGALDLIITYDSDKLTFVDVQNNINGANVNRTSDDVIHITWTSQSSVDINSKFLDLLFEYHNGGGVASASVNFADGCQFSSLTPVANIPVNYVNGGINFIFTVSGTLLYDNHPPYVSTLAGFTVNLKDAGNNIVGTDVTDGSGNYSITAPNGIYTLEGVPPIDPMDAPWFASEASHDIIYSYAAGYNEIVDETPLKILAMDVNLDGWPLEDDADLVYARAAGFLNPEFTAPDWLFETHSVIVNNADLTGQEFFGICSGDVAGEGPIF